MFKKVLIGIAVVVVVAIGGALVAPSFIDWNARVPEIAAQVKRATGRDLAIEGQLSLRILPAPMLTARNVRFGNAPGGQETDMATLEAVEVRVALMPLLSGEVQVERIRLVKPNITFEKYADGSTNLEFRAQPGDGSTAAQGAGGTDAQVSSGGSGAAATTAGGGLGVRLDNFEIVDGVMTYVDVGAGTREQVRDITAKLRAASLEGPFDASGEARVRGVPLAFEATVGEMIAGRTVTVNARVNAPGRTNVDIQGAVLELNTAPRFKGKLKVEGANLAQLLDAVLAQGGTAPALPPLLQSNFAISTDMEAGPAQATLDAVEIELGENRVSGALSAGWGDAVVFSADLNATRIDADALLQASNAQASSRSGGGTSGASASSPKVAPTPPTTAGAAGGQGFALPQNVSGQVDVTIGAVTYQGGLVRDVRLSASLDGGELTLSQLQAQAPGVTDLALFGFVRPQDGKPRFNGDLEITTADPAGLARWLGVDVPPGVAGRVKRVALTSKITADQDLLTLGSLKLTGDRTTLTGGVSVALRARPSFGADLKIDALNVDAYTNGNGVAGATGGAAPPSGGGTGTAQAGQSSSASQAMGLAGVWQALSALNTFDANLKLAVGNLTVGGDTFKDLSLDGTLYAGTLDLRRLRVGNAFGTTADVKGGFTGFGGVPELKAVTVSANVNDVNATAARFGQADALPKGLGALEAVLKANGSIIKPDLDATVNALGAALGARGQFSLLPIGFGFTGQVTANHANAQALATKLGYQPQGPLGALNLKTDLKTDGQVHELTNIDAAIGKTNIAGTVTARTGANVPDVNANLNTGVLNVSAFLAKSDKRADAHNADLHYLARLDRPTWVFAQAGATPQLAQAGGKVDARWSRQAFDLSALNAFNGELALKSAAIVFGDYELKDADIHATVKDGVLNADKVKGSLFGGPVSGQAVVRANGTPTIDSNLQLSAVNVGQAVRAVAGKDLAAGLLGANVDFKATGASPADLITSLSGSGAMNINELNVRQTGTGTALAPVIGLVGALNQFALPAAGKSRSGLADVSLNFNIDKGVADVTQLALDSALGKGTGSGKVDLAGWAIDFAGNMTVEANLLTTLLSQGRIGKQEIPFSLNGQLDKPGVKLAVNPAGASGGQASQPKSPVENLLQRVLPQQRQQPAPSQPSQPAQPQQNDGTLAPPPPATGGSGGTQSGGGTSKKLTPEEMIRQLMQGL